MRWLERDEPQRVGVNALHLPAGLARAGESNGGILALKSTDREREPAAGLRNLADL